MDVAVAGGHGKIALDLTRRLAARGDTVRSLVRNPDHVTDAGEAGGEPVVIDLETASAAELAQVLGSAGAVVFAAGAGPGSGAARKETVDYAAAVTLIEACRLAGIDRYLMISARSADPDREGDEVYDIYCRAKGRADAALAASGLDYVILRPVTLTDGPATGRVSASESRGELVSNEISRGDVALTLAELLLRPEVTGRTFYICAGETPIDRAF